MMNLNVKNETFDHFMRRLAPREPIGECIIVIAAKMFFDGSRNKAETAVKEWSKTNGHVFKYSTFVDASKSFTARHADWCRIFEGNICNCGV